MSEAARAWTSVLDGWWRQQAAMLPPDLERAMGATLDQSKALVELAVAQSARAVEASFGDPSRSLATPSEALPVAASFGLWQPVIDACRDCETRLVGRAGDSDSPRSSAAREYQRAAGAYMNEFVQINGDLAQRLQKKLALNPPADFRRLHALVVEEAENAYLDRVSTDAFAALQAAYINAMFRLRRETGGAGPGESS